MEKIANRYTNESSMKAKAKSAYGHLESLRKKHPIGTVRDVINLKNEGRK